MVVVVVVGVVVVVSEHGVEGIVIFVISFTGPWRKGTEGDERGGDERRGTDRGYVEKVC